MDPKTYVKGVLETESIDRTAISNRCLVSGNLRLLHAALGMVTEAGEFADVVKKYLFYGKEIDTINLMEELGDQLWYISIAMDVLGVSFEEIMQQNHNKLFNRYSKGFSEKEANNRDLDKERKILEDKK
jgi:NTP pyrophosphatase (non-canonical NTP hydrolase)